VKNVITRYHAAHPWTVPGKLIGEFRGMLAARRLARKGPKLIGSEYPENAERSTAESPC
jgi:hypothetical protein